MYYKVPVMVKSSRKGWMTGKSKGIMEERDGIKSI